LKLRRGVRFHDGAPFNPEAVVFNFDRWRLTDHPYYKGGGGQTSDFSYHTGQFGGLDDDSIITNVEAVDEYTVRFTLKEPQGPFVRNLTMSPLAIASPKAIKENVEDSWKNPVGTGPYKFVKWERNAEVDLEANDEWWGSDVPVNQGGGGPKLKQVVIRSILDNTSRRRPGPAPQEVVAPLLFPSVWSIRSREISGMQRRLRSACPRYRVTVP
jgi:peptide/nickel transport system substrate-binding protein